MASKLKFSEHEILASCTLSLSSSKASSMETSRPGQLLSEYTFMRKPLSSVSTLTSCKHIQPSPTSSESPSAYSMWFLRSIPLPSVDLDPPLARMIQLFASDPLCAYMHPRWLRSYLPSKKKINPEINSSYSLRKIKVNEAIPSSLTKLELVTASSWINFFDKAARHHSLDAIEASQASNKLWEL